MLPLLFVAVFVLLLLSLIVSPVASVVVVSGLCLVYVSLCSDAAHLVRLFHSSGLFWSNIKATSMLLLLLLAGSHDSLNAYVMFLRVLTARRWRWWRDDEDDEEIKKKDAEDRRMERADREWTQIKRQQVRLVWIQINSYRSGDVSQHVAGLWHLSNKSDIMRWLWNDRWLVQFDPWHQQRTLDCQQNPLSEN